MTITQKIKLLSKTNALTTFVLTTTENDWKLPFKRSTVLDMLNHVHWVLNNPEQNNQKGTVFGCDYYMKCINSLIEQNIPHFLSNK
jgi:hypothetical protein